MIDAANALGDVQSVRVRLAAVTEPSLIVEPYSIDDQRIAFPMANGVAHPARFGILHMAATIGKDLADVVAVFEKHEHSSRSVNKFHWIKEQIDSRHAGGKTLKVGVVRIYRGSLRSGGMVGLDSFLAPGGKRQGTREGLALGIEPDELLSGIIGSCRAQGASGGR